MADEHDESSVNTAIKSVGTGPAAQEAYRDLLKPAFQELSPSLRAMAQCIALALLPLKAVAWSYEKIQQWLVPDLARKLADVPPEKVRSPDLTIAGPTLLYLPFVEHQEPLREMYARLLATSMTEGRDEAHPSFVHIIQQLTSDEARILAVIKSKGEKFQLDETDAFNDRRPGISSQFNKLCEGAEVVMVEHSDAYLDNLLRLRILCELIDANSTLTPEGDNRHGWHAAEVTTENRRVIMLTDFGKNFLRACT